MQRIVHVSFFRILAMYFFFARSAGCIIFSLYKYSSSKPWPIDIGRFFFFHIRNEVFFRLVITTFAWRLWRNGMLLVWRNGQFLWGMYIRYHEHPCILRHLLCIYLFQMWMTDNEPAKPLKRRYGLQTKKVETNHAASFNAYSEASIVRTSFCKTTG